ncbi:16S rRNA m(2)G 1207 methyltransferase [Oceanobacillus limi]|uniref:16S rRNA m(2)G 1207 methyltransferase n=1 Tax=Oceanobacillus limi TaxID=930131 RepID=A0A1I0GRG8_9BACI|nr:class I SAM-dependent methyltransferase [Oceanobacillus limi]SET72928.1 16S rRNA m(2)G 1207 methyltransferase [Oceanobacillus limi]
MSEHYFSQKPQSKRSPKTWNYQLKGKQYIFTSDIGVFSKNEVDFGSRLLIENFRHPNVSGDILDMGCGYGPIGVVLADHYTDRKVIMADINERALELAEENAKRNGVNNTLFVHSNQFSELKEQKYAAIVTNPPIRAGKKVVHGIFEESKVSLVTGGELWVVIQKKQGAPSAKDKLESLFGEVDVIARDKGYFILHAIND